MLHFKVTKEELFGFSDADWANDTIDRRSVEGFVFFLSSAPISWQSRKQTILAISTLESEYTAFLEVSKEALWLRQLLHDIANRSTLRTSEPSIDHLLNKIIASKAQHDAIQNVISEGVTARNKHFDVCLMKVREMVKAGVVKFIFRRSVENVADGFTKALVDSRHQEFVRQLSWDMKVDV
jgi:hypothetical protein